MNRKNLIDGLPNSYDTNYVLKTNKICEICSNLFVEQDIKNNKIVCSEDFQFYHKNCLAKKGILYSHYNSKDESTPVVFEKNNV